MLDHYRRGAPIHANPETALRAMFGRTEDEPLPDPARSPAEPGEFESPASGTCFDAFPVLVRTSSALEALQRSAPESHFDVRRFRPNLLLDTGDAPAGVKRDRIGRRLQIGELELGVEMACPRCIMTIHPFDDLPENPRLMRTLVRENDGDLGVYCRVTHPGTVRAGDAVQVV